MAFINRSYLILAGAAVLIIIFSNVIVAELFSKQPIGPSFKVLTYGPLWNNGDTWSCTSNNDFVVFGALRTPQNNTQFAIQISGLGTQSLYALDAGKLESFTVGANANQFINITRSGTITGWITMQTAPNATAGCSQS